MLYEQGDTDPLAVVLGATSIADALANLDSLDRIADQDRVVIEQTRQAKHSATALSRKLAAKERDLLGLATAGGAVDARARAVPLAARLVPGDAGEPAAG